MTTPQLVEASLTALLLVVGSSQLLHRHAWAAAFAPLFKNPALPVFLGIYAMLFGLVIAAAHNVWSGVPIVTTLIGWWGLVAGAACLLAPGPIGRLLAKMNITSALIMLGGSIRLSLGVAIGLGLLAQLNNA